MYYIIEGKLKIYFNNIEMFKMTNYTPENPSDYCIVKIIVIKEVRCIVNKIPLKFSLN